MPQKTQRPKLLPCPFCGGRPEVFRTDYEKSALQSLYGVACTQCGERYPNFVTLRSAVMAWNTRAEIQTTLTCLKREKQSYTYKCNGCRKIFKYAAGMVPEYCPRCGCAVVK